LVSDHKLFTVIGDSLIKGMDGGSISRTTVQCFRGATISRIASKVDKGVAVVKNFRACVLLVGTNDVADGIVPEVFLAEFDRLFRAIRAKNPNIFIVVSAIIPRLVDFNARGDKVHFLNEQLSVLTRKQGGQFLKSHKPFFTKGPRLLQVPQRKYFNRGKLHLSRKGQVVLRRLFAQALGKGSKARKMAGWE
jgi:lysophospholipase L1-like esterase